MILGSWEEVPGADPHHSHFLLTVNVAVCTARADVFRIVPDAVSWTDQNQCQMLLVLCD